MICLDVHFLIEGADKVPSLFLFKNKIGNYIGRPFFNLLRKTLKSGETRETNFQKLGE